MMIEITGITITAKKISISGTNLESFLLADDLDEQKELDTVVFDFDRSSDNIFAMKYLYKVVKGLKRNSEAKSFGEMLRNLQGEIIFLSDNFLTKSPR